MKCLGLSYDFHDASAAIVADSRLLASAAEERFTLHKHDANYPTHAIDATLQLAGLAIQDLDVVAFYERPHEKFARLLQDAFAGYPRGSIAFARSMKKWLGGNLWTRNLIARRLAVKPNVVEFFPHHHSHVVQAFAESPFENAAVLVVDGVGEWCCTTLASADRNGTLQVHEQYDYPQSIGLVYAAFTAFLGFKPNSGESSTMALAAFGTPRYVDEVRKVLRRNADDTYSVSPGLLNFLGDERQLFTAQFLQLFGEPRAPGKQYGFDALLDEQHPPSAEDQHYADVAASLQWCLTDVLLGLCRRLQHHSKHANLCLAGGVALNCLANSEIVKHSGFAHCFIPADPGDGGAAAGAAALAGGFSKPAARATPYLGPQPAIAAIQDLLASDYLCSLAVQQRRPGVVAPTRIAIAHLAPDQLAARVVDDLAAGKIVAWVQGRLETGARALGNRSLLVDPGNLAAIRRLSHTVKSHTRFRPYALSMTSDTAAQVLECPWHDSPVLRWMQTIWPVRETHRTRLRAGIHYDGTTRPQICSRDDNPLFWDLLSRFHAATGLPALLNTSFNERSMPMIGEARAALITFLRTGVDTLAIGDTLLQKTFQR